MVLIALTLDVRQKISNMLQTELGFQLTKDFSFVGGCWAPYLGLSGVSKIPLGSGKYRSSFQSQNKDFVVATTTKVLNQVVPNIGCRVTAASGLSMTVDFRTELAGQSKSYFANLRLDYPF